MTTNEHAALDRRDLLGICSGDDDAFRRVYLRHRITVRTSAQRVLHDGELADDICQEVFTALWSRPDAVDLERGTLATYLRTLAHHRAVDLTRSETARRRRQIADLERNLPLAHADDDVADEVVHTAWRDECSAAVRAAFSRLSEQQRVAVELAYYGERTRSAISSELGVPEGTVKTRIRDAIATMRTLPEVAALQTAGAAA